LSERDMFLSERIFIPAVIARKWGFVHSVTNLAERH